MSVDTISRAVVKTVYATEQPEGVGARVRRSLGSTSLPNITPFLLLDYFEGAEGAGFPDHPHRGQATVTYMLQGSSRHEDSAGHKGVIVEGGVQWMCAGRGIIHSEIPVTGVGVPQPKALQLWIDLPRQYKMAKPSYQEFGPERIPVAYPESPDGPVSIKVISGKSHDVESPVRPLGGCWYFHVKFTKKSSVFQDIPTGWTAFAYILKGIISVGESPKAHEPHHGVVFSSESQQNGVSITALQNETEFVLIAGEPLKQPIVQEGPFVMTSKEAIQKTLLDYQLRKNGFEKAGVWKSKIGETLRKR